MKDIWNQFRCDSVDGLTLTDEQRDWCENVALSRLHAKYHDELSALIREEMERGLERVRVSFHGNANATHPQSHQEEEG